MRIANTYGHMRKCQLLILHVSAHAGIGKRSTQDQASVFPPIFPFQGVETEIIFVGDLLQEKSRARLRARELWVKQNISREKRIMARLRGIRKAQKMEIGGSRAYVGILIFFFFTPV